MLLFLSFFIFIGDINSTIQRYKSKFCAFFTVHCDVFIVLLLCYKYAARRRTGKNTPSESAATPKPETPAAEPATAEPTTADAATAEETATNAEGEEEEEKAPEQPRTVSI